MSSYRVSAFTQNIVTELFLTCVAEDSTIALNRRCTNSDSEVDDEEEENEIEDEKKTIPARDGTEYVLGLNEFKLLYLISQRNDPKTTEGRLSVAIVLPSGVEKGGFAVHVVDNVIVLECRVRWSRLLLTLTFCIRVG
ncbi:hypothetical protein FGB62_46g16 [Gracilaria domingensis]|nr:hypothetical protein FGB62_46g16 [Gracilaria domingensis]